MQTEVTRRLFNVYEYCQMADAGILSEHVRTELINGEILEMSPMGVRHRSAVNRASDLLVPMFKGVAQISIQLPVRLNDFNEPQPDLCFLKPRRDFYETKYPGAGDVSMVMEISDTSLGYDRDVKLAVYAASRIPEVWIENLVDQTLMVFRNPARKAYGTALTFRHEDSVSLLAFPETLVAVSDLLG